jgi:hypothetical protein
MFRNRRRQLGVQNLEARVLMHGGHGEVDFSTLDSTPCEGAQDDVPALHSLPGAATKIFLDFDGHYEDQWGSTNHIDIVGFNLEGACNQFSQRELDVIKDVWRAVAEDFVPFDIDVTTVDPGSFDDGEALRVVIGGNAWTNSTLGETTSGIAKRNSFTKPDISNVAYVFSKNIEERGGFSDDAGLAAMIGTTVSHEAGHSFGLSHQSAFDASGTETAEYSTGTATWTPIMGANRSTDRTTWHNGPTTSATTLQNDLAVIASDTNGFGYRFDEAGETAAAAVPMGMSFADSDLKVTGVIATTSDVDVYRFQTDGGQTTIDLDVTEFANLDAKMRLFSMANGTMQVIADADPAGALGATITADLSAGEYFVAVGSHGTYGDVGYYRITVDLGGGDTGPISPHDWAYDLQWTNELLDKPGPPELRRPGPVPDPVPYEKVTKDVLPAPTTKEMAVKQSTVDATSRAVSGTPDEQVIDRLMDELGAGISDPLTAPRTGSRAGGRR